MPALYEIPSITKVHRGITAFVAVGATPEILEVGPDIGKQWWVMSAWASCTPHRLTSYRGGIHIAGSIGTAFTAATDEILWRTATIAGPGSTLRTFLWCGGSHTENLDYTLSNGLPNILGVPPFPCAYPDKVYFSFGTTAAGDVLDLHCYVYEGYGTPKQQIPPG